MISSLFKLAIGNPISGRPLSYGALDIFLEYKMQNLQGNGNSLVTGGTQTHVIAED